MDGNNYYNIRLSAVAPRGRRRRRRRLLKRATHTQKKMFAGKYLHLSSESHLELNRITQTVYARVSLYSGSSRYIIPVR